MHWKCGSHTLDLSRKGLVLAVLNVTPDSFSDGGRYFAPATALLQARRLLNEGADIIDVGGESTRPGAAPVNEAEEMHRVLPVIEAIAREGVIVSIDTMKPGVAAAAIECGAAIINDVTGLRNPEMQRVVQETGAGAIVMHMQGEPQTMQKAPYYVDVLAEIRDFFRQTYDRCITCGMDARQLAFDPGIGFGKRQIDNLALLRSPESIRVCGRPLVYGVSRKSFFSHIFSRPEQGVEDRDWGTVALTAWLRGAGVEAVRVHRAQANRDAMRMTEVIHQGLAQPPIPATTSIGL